MPFVFEQPTSTRAESHCTSIAVTDDSYIFTDEEREPIRPHPTEPAACTRAFSLSRPLYQAVSASTRRGIRTAGSRSCFMDSRYSRIALWAADRARVVTLRAAPRPPHADCAPEAHGSE